MFYSHDLLARKGQFGKIWIACTLKGRISKKMALSVNLRKSVEGVCDPPVPLALRVSGMLLFGICVVYDKQARFLLADLGDYLQKIQKRTHNLDFTLPTFGQKFKNRFDAVTLPAEEDALPFLDLNTTMGSPLVVSWKISEKFPSPSESCAPRSFVARAEDITLPDSGAGVGGDLFRPREELGEFFEGGLEHMQEDVDGAEQSSKPGASKQKKHAREEDTSPPLQSVEINENGGAHVDPEPEFQEVPKSPDAAAEVPTVAGVQLRRNKGARSRKRTRRSLIIDRETELAGDFIRASLQSAGDITRLPQDIGGNPLAEEHSTFAELLFRPASTGWAPELVSRFILICRDAKEELVKDPTPSNKRSRASEQKQEEGAQVPNNEGSPPMREDVQVPDFDEPEQLRAAEQIDTTEETPMFLGRLSDVQGKTPLSGSLSPNSASRRNLTVEKPESEVTPAERSSAGRKSTASLSRLSTPVDSSHHDYMQFEVPDIIHGAFQQEVSQNVDYRGSCEKRDLKSSISKATWRMISYLKSEMQGNRSYSFFRLTQDSDKYTVARSFFQILVLASLERLEVNQLAPYGDIIMKKGPSFDSDVESVSSSSS